MKRFTVLMMWVGCGGATPTVAQAPLVDLTEPAPSDIDVSAVSGVYSGYYVCPQGPTGLTLTVQVTDSGSAEAIFEFYPTPDNPYVPTGQFAMRGKVDGTEFLFEADEQDWIKQPPGYATIDLRGFVNEAKSELAGEIVQKECSTFYLRRVD